MPRLTLDVVPGRLAVCRLEADAGLEAWMGEGAVSSVTRTASEVSVVCAEGAVPPGVRAERGWRALAVRGPLDFGLTGILASLASTLAAAGVSIFAVSTYDTDLILVKAAGLEAAVGALRVAGHRVEA